MQPVTISLIIPTYNGAHRLEALFSSIEAQSRKPDEIILVVDGSTDTTSAVIQPWERRMPALKVIWQPNSGRAVVRNRGASEASGNLLIFFDDDMIASPECIAVHELAHRRGDDRIVAGAIPDLAAHTDFQRFKKQLAAGWEKELEAAGEEPLGPSQIYLSAANFSLPRTLFFSIGGFDPRINDAEDFDLAVRARLQGIPVFYVPGAIAYHNDPITARAYIRRLRQYRNAHRRLRELEPARYRTIPMHEPVVPSGLKGAFFRFFASAWWIRWADKYAACDPVARFLRYKLYDWIVTANGSFFPDKVPLD